MRSTHTNSMPLAVCNLKSSSRFIFMDLPLFKKGFTIHLNLQNMMNMFRGKPRLEVGMTVEANYNGQGKWYKGQITKDRENGTFDIEFENGKNENAVPLKSIKTMETSVSLADRSIDSQTSRFKIPAIQDHFPVMFESAGSSKAPSVAGDDHSVTSASSNNSRANKTTISKFFHFGSTATTPITPNIPPVIVESKTISMDTSSIASQAKAALVDLQPVLVPSYDIPAEPVVVVSKLSRKKLNKTSMKERIRRFYETDTKAIDLSDLDLVMVPIAELKGLSESVRSLNLSRNNLFEGLLHMRLFSTLVQLDLSLNGLTSLQSADGSFSSLRALKSVDLSRNALTAFPVELLGLSSLETLVMHHNLLSALPPQDQMSSLKALCLLDVSHNCLDGVTDELEGLSRLGDLNLGHNRDDSGREMDTRSMGARAKELHEKRELFVSKTARRALVSRAIDVQKRVVAREQERIVREYNDSHRAASRSGSKGASRGDGGSRGASREGAFSGRTSPTHVE